MAEPTPITSDSALRADTAIRLRRIGKVYDNGVKALGPLDLDVRKGEFISLLGPSGCGKSTALRIIAGLSAPTSGEVRVVGHTAVRAGQSIGFVFQEPTLMPWATVHDNVQLPLKLARIARVDADRRVGEALARVGLAERLTHRPHELSGGERQRAAVARALVTQPRIVLADEPTGNLDGDNAESVFALLLELNRELGTSLIVVTHDSRLAARMDRILEIKQGNLVGKT